jgi:cytochrome c biogenesis protein CcdA
MDFIDQVSGSLGGATPVAYGLVMVAGLLIGLTPCNLPLVPLVIGYAAGYGSNRRRTMLLVSWFALGAATAYGVFGAVAALFGAAFQSVIGKGWYGLLGGACILIGLLMTGVVRSPVQSPAAPVRARYGGSWASAFLLGGVMSLASSACCLGPVFAILMYSAAQGRVLHGAATLFAFGLGKSIPLLVVGAGAGAFRSLAKATRWAHYIEAASGLLLIATGFYFLRIAWT